MSSTKTWRPFWKALWYTWRLHVDIFSKPFPYLSGKAEICSSNLLQTVLLTCGPSLSKDSNRDNGISLSSREDVNFSGGSTQVAWPIKYVLKLCNLKAESVSDQNLLLISNCFLPVC